MKRTSNIGGIR